MSQNGSENGNHHASEVVKKPGVKAMAWFLGLVTVVILVMLAGLIWQNIDPAAPMRLAYTPSTDFAEDSPLPAPDYSQDNAWLVRPGIKNRYVDMRPKDDTLPPFDHKDAVDVFYIHPTSGFKNDRWNAAFDDVEANARSNALATKSHISIFAPSATVYAPKYRQANFGSFFVTPERAGNALQAIMLAYGDIVASFQYYLKHHNKGRPFIIASHSQGSMHALPLLMMQLKGTEAGKNLIAAYVIGWPVSVEADMPALGFAACNSPTDLNCIISWQAFGIESDAKLLQAYFNNTPGFTGLPRAGTKMLCTNPLSWEGDGSATAAAHMGAITLYVDNTPLEAIAPERFGAACTSEGILKIDRLLRGNVWEQLQMPGMNMHAYDYNLFYMNTRQNVRTRIKAWMEK